MEVSGILVFLGSVVVSRLLNERGYRKLDKEQKLRLMDGFSSVRAYSILPIVVILLVYWLLVTKTELNRAVLSYGYFAVLLLHMVGRTVFDQQKMSRLEMPREYQRVYALSQGITFSGLTWFLFTLIPR